jgi:LPXTG-motif cell wall-anchored protein
LDEDLLDESLYIVNKLTTEEITVNKYWDDENNKYGSRPATLDITLTNDGATVKTFTLGAGEDNTANKWSATVTVPKPVEESSYNAAEGENGDGVENYEQEYYKSNTDADGNCVIDIVNKPDKINIVIEKIWQDAGNAYRTRPTSITFNLYQGENKEPVETETFKAEDCADPYDTSYWYCTFEDLDPGYEYSIEEVVVSGYTTTYSNESMTVTNTLNWQIIKQSTSEDSTTGNHPKLAGAEFTLKGETKIYYGLSNAEGVIQWYASAQDIKPVESFEDGTYTLTETKAPAGYSVSTEEWKLEMKGNVPTITVEGETKSCNTSTNGVVTFLYEDEVLYSLPEAGGEGIFLFVIAGMLLMMGGALLIFAQRRRVLRI